MKRAGLRILLLEDEKTDALLLERELHKVWQDFELEVIYDKEKLVMLLHQKDWDLIISDYMMPQLTGLEAVKIVREYDIEVPFIMVSGTMGESIAVEVMKAGADDYLLKQNLHRLNIVIKKLLKEKDRLTSLQITRRELKESHFLSEAIIKDSPLGIVVRDERKRVIHFNRSWQRIWGFSDAEVNSQIHQVSENWEDFYGYVGDYRDKLRLVFEQGGELFIPEIKLERTRANRAKWISQHFYSLGDETGKVNRIVSITEDISDKKAEETFFTLKTQILEELNNAEFLAESLEKILSSMRSSTGHDSWGIRLEKGNDYPYLVTLGFNEEFIRAENSLLCENDAEKQFDCLCGRVLLQDHQNRLPYFNKYGSFWINDLSELSKESEEILQSLVNRAECLRQGYKSLALIPIKAKGRILGLLQIEDFSEGKFNQHEISNLEEISRILGIGIQRLQTDQEIQKHHNNLNSLINNTSDVIWSIDKDYRLLTFNDTFLDFTKDLYGKRLSYNDLLIDDDKLTSKVYSFWKEIYDRVLKGNPYQMNYVKSPETPQIRYMEMSFNPIKGEEHEVIGLTAFARDVTERKKAKHDLAQSKQKFETAFHASPVIMGLSDVESGRYFEVNRTFYELLGYTAEEVIGKRSVEVLNYPQETRDRLAKELREKGLVKDFDVQVSNKTGGKLDLQLSAKVIELDGKKVNFVTAIDVTEKKKVQQDFMRAHQELEEMHRDLKKKVERTVMELRSRDMLVIRQARQTGQVGMLSQIAHHWRQPLNAIGVLIQSLAEAYEFDELSAAVFDEKIDSSMKILRELSQSIDNFRMIYGSEEKEKLFEVSKYLREIANLSKARFKNKNIVFEIDLEAEGLVEGTASDFAQALINILDNSFEILVSRKVSNPQVRLCSKRLRNEILITVSDNGGGIKPEMEQKLFLLYSSSKESLNNTGIGLYMTKTIIGQMEGTIEVENKNAGAEFRILVPLYNYQVKDEYKNSFVLEEK